MSEESDLKVIEECDTISAELKAKGASDMAAWLAAYVHFQGKINGRTEFSSSELAAAWDDYQSFAKTG